jgi:hypothetical protein
MGRGGVSGRWWCAPDCTREDAFVHAPRVAAHGIHAGGSAPMMFAWAGTHRAGVVVIHIAAVHVAIMPVFKMLDGVCCRSVGSGSAAAATEAAAVVAATAVEAAATTPAAAVAATTAVAAAATVVASAATAVIASASAAVIPIEYLGAAAARSPATASLVSSAAVGRVLLLVIGHHVGGGMGSKHLAEHLNLPLHGVDGLVAGVLAFLCGLVRCPKVGYSIREGGAVVFGSPHAVAMGAGRGSGEGRNIHCICPKGTKGNEVVRLRGIVAVENPSLVLL